jgi:hypothetical protein
VPTFTPHRRLTFSGIFGPAAAPYERWAFRFNLFNNIGAVGSLQALVDAAQASWTGQLALMTHGMARLTEIKTAPIGVDGLYTGDPFIKNMNVPGTNNQGGKYPPQVALAVSLNTATRGPRGRGRIFLPAPGAVFGGDDGAISASDATEYATRVASLINAINGVSGFGSVAVASSFGGIDQVTSVRCGRVYDTIRSRRSSIVEAYVANVGTTQSAG